jgi:hypothetical protein
MGIQKVSSNNRSSFERVIHCLEQLSKLRDCTSRTRFMQWNQSIKRWVSGLRNSMSSSIHEFRIIDLALDYG